LAVRKKIMGRIRVMRRLAGTTWGCNTADLRAVFITYVQSAALYGSEVYLAWASDRMARRVESAQAAGARVISGCTSDTRNEIALREAKVMPLQRMAQANAGILQERLKRLPSDNPARMQVEREDPADKTKKLFTGSFRRLAKEAVYGARLEGLATEPLLTAPAVPPWMAGEDIKFHPELESECQVTREDTAEDRKAAAEVTLALLRPAWLHVYTDGSADCGLFNGGAGIVLVIDGEGTVHNDCVPAGSLCGSYRAEMTGLRDAVPRILQGVAEGWLKVDKLKAIRFCTDSQSAVRRLAKGAAEQTTVMGAEIWSGLMELEKRTGCPIDVQFVPGHAGVEGNEQADKMAEQGAKLPQVGVAIDLATAKASILREMRSRWNKDLQGNSPAQGADNEEGNDDSASEGGEGGSGVSEDGSERAGASARGNTRGEARVSSLVAYREAATKGKAAKFSGVPGSTPGQFRQQERALSQMKAGKCPLMRGYLHMVRKGKTRPEQHCELCAKYAPEKGHIIETVQHFLVECKFREFRRLSVFKKLNIGLEVLFTEPIGVLEYLNLEGRLDLPEPPDAATASS
jgi:ribonuclease HI